MKVLVIRFSSLGDCVLLCPLLAHLKACGADEVAVVTKSAYAEVFACADGVDRVAAIAKGGGPRALERIARDLRPRGYTVVDAHNNPRSRFLSARLGGARARLAKHYRDRLGLVVFKRPTTLPTILEQYAALARVITTAPPTLRPGGITIPPALADRVASRWNPRGRRGVAIAPGSRWEPKRWGADRYLALARALVEDHGCHVVLVGDDGDAALTGSIAQALGSHATDVAGRATIMETAAWIRRCDGFVGNDSGLMHLAEAVGVPVVGLFGPTVVEFGYFPALAESKTIERSLACRPCSRNGARPCIRTTNECLATIDAPMVEAVVADMLERLGARRTVLS